MRKRAKERGFTIRKSDGSRVDDKKKSDGVTVVPEKESDGVRFDHKKGR